MKQLIKMTLNTQANNASLMLRLILGAVLFAHGARGMMGWFGGGGFTNTMHYFTEIMGLAYVIGFAVICLQFFGSLLLILGAATRFVAFAVFIMFLGMVLIVHLEHGFFMNWYGSNSAEGFEYHILVMGICSALVILGGGVWSVDRKLAASIA